MSQILRFFFLSIFFSFVSSYSFIDICFFGFVSQDLYVRFRLFRFVSSDVFPCKHCSDWFVQICVHIICVQMCFFRFVVECCSGACADIQMFRFRYSDIQTLRYSALSERKHCAHVASVPYMKRLIDACVFELYVLQPFQAQPSSRAACNEKLSPSVQL